MSETPHDQGDIIGRLAGIFAHRGAEAYLGEAITMAEHMLQCAALATAESAPDALVAAALLHDIGQFTGAFEYSPEDTQDNRHEAAGAAVLDGVFPPMVVEAVRLHVPAKRYLCATDATYRARLSPASQHTLALQGGPMRAAELARFESHDFHREAVRLRLWDDAAKVAGVQTPAFDDFRPLLQGLLL